ncbi:PEP/pyruvate-binding domain-containing protein [Paenibacillus aceti]|uniref:Phosphoenolpyruvate synthase n=1 Tax=Paenibacillus aceti TaxID=1820010 RepID=A0ABQ1VWN0_9BACL|nr:PEP/pyruvate-binding domain-containing protein [Paenibacillus aceti]GGG03130.1 hypothetical protein GCM10010913_26110 [Paenibacillus aceti]
MILPLPIFTKEGIDIRTVISIEQAAEVSLELIGAKAWRLGVAHQQGIQVPRAIIIPYELIELDRPDWKSWLLGQLQAYFDLDATTLAVRSSSTVEDLAQASAAGIFESVLGVRGIDQIADAVEECVRALHSDVAVKYAERLGNARMQMNIIIQQLISPRKAGVMITGRPSSQQFIAEGAWGLAVDLVSGAMNPDFLTASLSGGEDAITRKGSQTEVCERAESGQGLSRRGLNPEEQAAELFEPGLNRRLAALGSSVRSIFEGDQEVEWAEDHDGTLWLIQSRPFMTRTAFRGTANG